MILPRPIFIAGHNGLVGSASTRACAKNNLPFLVASRSELDLRDQVAVKQWMITFRPSAVIIAAAKVGGILANNTLPYDFIMQNLMIQVALIEACKEACIDRVIFLGSSCIYPKHAPQPISEASLLTGLLEATNEPYAIAKIAGIKLIESCNRQYGTKWMSLMPTNLYGPKDNFDLETSHVLPAMIRKFHIAKLAKAPHVTLWGTGAPLREFLYVDDLADACLHVLSVRNTLPYDLINVGSGSDLSIRNLAYMVQSVVGYEGTITWDSSKPDGTPRKLMDSSRILSSGWSPRVDLESGIRKTYQWFLENTSATT
jgi:GDP-L-fucose synthase